VLTMLQCADDDVELEPDVLTEKLALSLNSDFERLRLGAVCSSLQLKITSSFFLQ